MTIDHSPKPEPDVHPLISAVNSVLSPPPAAPAGVLKWRDFGVAAFSALVKSGVVYAALSAIGSMPNAPTIVIAVVAICSTLLRLYTAEPASPGVTSGTGV